MTELTTEELLGPPPDIAPKSDVESETVAPNFSKVKVGYHRRSPVQYDNLYLGGRYFQKAWTDGHFLRPKSIFCSSCCKIQ